VDIIIGAAFVGYTHPSENKQIDALKSEIQIGC
jgi:hypothetical protein